MLARNIHTSNTNEQADQLVALVEFLDTVSTDSELTKENEISITDNNGGRILF